MKPITTALVHRVLPPERGVDARHPTLILLHGRGADEEDLLGLAPALDKRLLIISVCAPYPFSSGGHTWYDLQQIGTPDPTMFRSSCDNLRRCVDAFLLEYPVDPSRLFLLGFSMGAVMSFALGLTHPETFRGIAAHSGYVPEGTHLQLRWQDLARTHFFVAHGTFDPVIPMPLANRARELFSRSSAPFTFREYPIAHQISEESLADIATWMRPLLETASE